ncbi:MAG: PIN domain-containing protein [Muribaculaceae bacterium]|nr:PIN domain-containing protein [Muribaculaceae bacterium]
MKNQFFGAYKLNEKELKDFFADCQFFFDTNTLLNLYRVRKDMAIRIISTISKQKQRVSIPYHVADEYHKKIARLHAQRLTVSQQMQQLCSSDESLMKKIFSDAFLNFLQQEEILRLKEIIHSISGNISVFINEKTTEFNDEFKSMEIAYLLSDELSECVLPPLAPERIAQLKEEFKERADKKIPPGYKDKNKAKNGEECEYTNEAGDYIIWTEMIKWASEHGKDVLFVSNEKKTDWIWEECGLPIGPRRELCKEFKENTGGRRFQIIKLDTFLSLTDDEYSDKEIKEIVEETKQGSTPLRKDDLYFNLFSTNSYFDYDGMFERIEDIQKRFKEFRLKSKEEKGHINNPQTPPSTETKKSTEKPDNPLKDPILDKDKSKDSYQS